MAPHREEQRLGEQEACAKAPCHGRIGAQVWLTHVHSPSHPSEVRGVLVQLAYFMSCLAGAQGSHLGRSCHQLCHHHHYQATPLQPMAADKQAGPPWLHSVSLSCRPRAVWSQKSERLEASTSLSPDPQEKLLGTVGGELDILAHNLLSV